MAVLRHGLHCTGGRHGLVSRCHACPMNDEVRRALAEPASAVLVEHDLIAMYLVGSHARDDFREDSDVDIAVLPCRPNADALAVSAAVAAHLQRHVDRPLDVTVLSLSDLPLLASLLRDAVLIACVHEPSRVAFEVEAMTRTLDFEQHAAPLRRELLAQTARGER